MLRLIIILIAKNDLDTYLFRSTNLKTDHRNSWNSLFDRSYVDAFEFSCTLYLHENQITRLISVDRESYDLLFLNRLIFEIFVRRLWPFWHLLAHKHCWSHKIYNTFFGLGPDKPTNMFPDVCFDYRRNVLFQKLNIDYTILIWKLQIFEQFNLGTTKSAHNFCIHFRMILVTTQSAIVLLILYNDKKYFVCFIAIYCLISLNFYYRLLYLINYSS